MKWQSLLVSLLLSAAFSSQTFAHTRWDPSGLTPGRSTRDDIKSGPCGEDRGNNPTVLEAGSTIEVSFESTIFHQGYFRIAFSPANDQGFDNYVLAEDIPDVQGQRYRTATITLPDMECDACTLQLIQSMLDRPVPSDYFHCADIQLVRSQTVDTQAPGPVSGLVAVSGDESIHLNWTNPSDNDHWQTLVMVYLTEIGATPDDGVSYEVGENISRAWVAHIGAGESATLPELTSGTHYDIYVFTFDRALNYSQAVHTSQSVNVMPNIAPSVSVTAEQNDDFAWSVNTSGGQVNLQATITDENPSDWYAINWVVDIPDVEDTNTNDAIFSFDPANVQPGDYRVFVEVTDTGSPSLSDTAEHTLTITESDSGTTRSGGSLSIAFLILTLMSVFAATPQNIGRPKRSSKTSK